MGRNFVIHVEKNSISKILKKYLITIVGPTAIGKTGLSIKLAKHYNCEIVSCDSRQFYKEMNIGTAVPSKEELSEVRHHFIQDRSIHKNYNVGQFERDAISLLDKLFKKNNIVVMVGGSGLYVDAVINGLDYFPEIAPQIREDLNKQFETDGIEILQKQLKSLDLETYHSIDIQNPHRVIRALEVCLGSDNKYSFYKNKPKAKRNFTAIKIGLDAKRNIIYDRIEQRVDKMINEGLLDEAKSIHPYKDSNALQTVGYKELFNYFDGNFTLDFAISEIKKNTRRFAKRQNTWFKKDDETIWFDYQSKHEEIIKKIENLINSKTSQEP